MYAAKSSGKRRYAIFRDEMLAAVRERLDMREALREALGRGELSLRYQPVVALADERVVSLEALLRWERADGEIVGPDRFIAARRGERADRADRALGPARGVRGAGGAGSASRRACAWP